MSRQRHARDAPLPAAWFFQLNPDNFRSPEEADLYVAQCVGRQSAWFVGQNGARMRRGQPVFVWRSAGKRREGAGVIGRAVIEEPPVRRSAFEWERPFEKRRNGKDPRAVLRLTEAFSDKGRYLPKDRLKADFLLQKAKIVTCPQGSNFALNTAQVRRLERLLGKRRSPPAPEIPAPTGKLARVSFNSSGWKRPTNEAGEIEGPKTFNGRFGFGYEDWLFRSEWELNGWRYAFIQAFNYPWPSLREQVFDVSLFTIDRDGTRFAVGRIKGLEVLGPKEMDVAAEVFRERGWRDVMRREIKSVEGKPAALESSGWAPSFLNVRFRAANVRTFPTGTVLRTDAWLAKRWRYTLYDFDPENTIFGDIWSFRGRRARKLKKVKGKRTRAGSSSTEYDPLHEKMAWKLEKALRREYPGAEINAEEHWIDLSVRTRNALIILEIKTDPRPTMVIREAIGQLLEYSFHPCRSHSLPIQMVIVGRYPLGPGDAQFLAAIQAAFRVTYRVVSI